MELGPRLRAARTARNLSIRTLASETGFSPSFLSQVELGQSSPSLASLQRICRALEIDLPELLRAERVAAPTVVLRRADREAIRSEWSDASAASLLTAMGDDRLSGLLLSIEPGGRTGAIPMRSGTRALAYCVRGEVHLTLGEALHTLGAGDSVLIERSDAAWENVGRTRAELVLMSARFD